ncbi:hypothetical protein ACTPOK_09550 [Streptomyces inhibens]
MAVTILTLLGVAAERRTPGPNPSYVLALYPAAMSAVFATMERVLEQPA